MAPHTHAAGAPSALTHGLSSRWAMEALAEEVDALAPLLIGASPPTEAITKAARKAAEAIMRVNRVRAVKAYALNQAEHARRETIYAFDGLALVFKGEVYKLLAAELSRDINRMSKAKKNVAARPKGADPVADAMLKFLGENEDLWQRLDDYERRALSLRAKAIRELDFARIEAERQGTGQASPRVFQAR